MNGRSSRGTARACCAGIANQAVVTNVTAVLFVPFMRLYGFTYVQLGFLAAAGFAAQMAADILLLFLIDRAPSSALAALAAVMSCAGLVFYGCVPCLFAGAEFYGILAATVVFAFAGGMLEVVLSNAAEALPEGEAALPFLHTVYAWAQVALALFLLLWLSLFGAESWNFAVLALAALPAAVFALLPSARFPPPQKDAPARAAFKPLYLFAVFAVFFGYGAEAVMNQWVGTYAAELFGEELGSAAGCALFALCLGIGGALYVRISGKKRAGLPLLIGCALPGGRGISARRAPARDVRSRRRGAVRAVCRRAFPGGDVRGGRGAPPYGRVDARLSRDRTGYRRGGTSRAFGGGGGGRFRTRGFPVPRGGARALRARDGLYGARGEKGGTD